MVQPRAERLMNLHILLLGAKRFIGKDAIREACYPEHARGPAGDEAFERAFERDKDALRQIGAVIVELLILAVIATAQMTNEEAATKALEASRWPDGPYCPHCGCTGK